MAQVEGVLPTPGEVEFYVRPGPMTDVGGCPPEPFDGLPADPSTLCRVVQGLLVHEELAPLYGLELTVERREEVRTRSVAAMVEQITSLDPAPLAVTRLPDARMVGNCRHFATLTVGLLRRAGIPARARCGFADYFESGRMVDHWVTEHFTGGRWVRVDAQVDDRQQEILKPNFDVTDMPDGAFLPAGTAWRRCRDGHDDPDRFGIFDMWGRWFIANNVVRDLAALNKMELLPWDTWGLMAFRQDPDDAKAELLDTIADVVASDDREAIGRLYEESDDVKVPPAVFDGRFGVPHRLGVSAS